MEDIVDRDDLKHETNLEVYDFQQLQTLRSFFVAVFVNDKIIISKNNENIEYF